jgi:hypothetical protein
MIAPRLIRRDPVASSSVSATYGISLVSKNDHNAHAAHNSSFQLSGMGKNSWAIDLERQAPCASRIESEVGCQASIRLMLT